jgi:hypothetical protein
VRGTLDGAVEIEFVRRADAGEFAKPPQRNFDIAGAKRDIAVEIAKLALVPHLHRAEVAVCVLADAYTLGIVPIGAEWRRASCADPLLATLVAAFLLGETLAQCLKQLVEAAERLDLLLFFLGEILLGELLEPLSRDFGSERLLDQIEALEDVTEHPIELVEIALVLHQRCTRQVVERLDTAEGEILLHRFHQRQIFAQRHRQAGGFELMEKGREHA